jgi:hypothetical protein
MSRFFPTSEDAREARNAYKTGTLSQSLARLDLDQLETPRTRDWREMIEEFCRLLESLGVPDRDGADFAVIVPVSWQGNSSPRSISVDIGRRALAFARQPDSGPVVVSDEVFFDDSDLAKNLRNALIPVLVSYKNKRADIEDKAPG